MTHVYDLSTCTDLLSCEISRRRASIWQGHEAKLPTTYRVEVEAISRRTNLSTGLMLLLLLRKKQFDSFAALHKQQKGMCDVCEYVCMCDF